MKKILILFFGLFMTAVTVGQEYLDMWHDPNTTDFYAIQEKFNAWFENRDKGRGSGYKQFKRWEMFMEPRVYPSGRLFNYSKRILGEYEVFKRSETYQRSIRSANGDWEPLGPTSYTDGWGWNGGVGRINCFAFHPTNANIFYVGAPAGGLWKTTDGGSTWTCLTADLPLLGVSGIAVRPDAPNTIYMLTGDGDGGHTYSIGVLKSTNGGNTWTETDDAYVTSDLVRGYKLLMHPTDYNTLFIASDNGIWRTTNGGGTWTLEKSGAFTDIEFKPGDPTVMYAVSFKYFYKSTNSGDTWSALHTSDGVLPTTDFVRIAIGVTPANAETVCLIYAGGTIGFKGLYYSGNSGEGFDLRSSGLPNILGYKIDGVDSAHQAKWDLAIAVDPGNYSVIYTGGINVWKSIDYGATWTILSHWYNTGGGVGYTHADIHALEFNGSTLYCGSDGGVFKSTNYGADWTDLSTGLNIMQFYHIDVESTILTGGTQDNGCNQWNTSTSNATHSIGADGFACIIDYTNTNIRYQSDQNTKWRSTNGGASFSNISPGPPVHPGEDFWGADWIMHPSDPDILYVGSDEEVYRTTTAGTGSNAWINMNSAFPGEGPVELAQSAANGDVLYASNGEQVRRSTNANATFPGWVNITGNLSTVNAMITDMVVDPGNADFVWVVFSGFQSGDKVYFTNEGTNTSATWYNETLNLPNVPVNCITYEPGSAYGLYIGTDIGVFYKDDILNEWTYYSNGLPSVIVNDLDIEGSWLYAGTYGQGMWRSDLHSACPISLALTPANVPYSADNVGHWVYQASSSISSTVIMHGDVGMEVTYQAGGYVRLDPGFEITGNSKFVAKIGSCGSIITAPNPLAPVVPFRPIPVREKQKEKIRPMEIIN